MQVLNPGLNLDKFFARLTRAKKRALMLDYDGTLAPFRRERGKAVPYPGVREILSKFISSGRTRLVIISGRQINDLVPLLGLDALPEIWGSHGLERQKGKNDYRVMQLEEITRRGLAEADMWIKEEQLTAVCEKKPSGIAFHWRGMSKHQIERLKEKIQKKWLSLAPQFGLLLREFDGGLELRVSGITKATAIERIIKEMGPDTMLAYMGDDLTDEDAFTAISGRGLSVLVRQSFRDTAADVWLRPPEELLAFLEKWMEYGG